MHVHAIRYVKYVLFTFYEILIISLQYYFQLFYSRFSHLGIRHGTSKSTSVEIATGHTTMKPKVSKPMYEDNSRKTMNGKGV